MMAKFTKVPKYRMALFSNSPYAVIFRGQAHLSQNVGHHQLCYPQIYAVNISLSCAVKYSTAIAICVKCSDA